MKKLIKILCLTLATLMLVLPLTACKSSSSVTTESSFSVFEGDDVEVNTDEDVAVEENDGEEAENKGDKTENKKPTTNKNNTNKNNTNKNNKTDKAESKGDYSDLDLKGETLRLASIWPHGPGKAGTSTANTLRQKRVKELEKKYNCKIDFMVYTAGDATERLRTSVAAGKPFVDLYTIYTSQLPSYAFNGYLQNLDEIKTIDIKDPKWVSGHVDNGAFNGGHYAFSYENSSQPRFCLVFNKTLFKKQGWTLPYDLYKQDKWTWEECLKLAQKATDYTVERYGLGGMEYASSSILASFGGEVIKTNAKGAPTFVGDSEACKLANEFQQELKTKYKDYIWSPETTTWTTGLLGVRDGRVAMTITQLYMVRENILDMEEDYGIVPVPKATNKDGTYCSIQEDVPTTVMLANNPLAQEKGYILDQYNQPYKGYDQIIARQEMESYCRDNESVECLLDLMNNYGKFNRAVWFKEAYDEYSKALGEVNGGKATFKEAMGKHKNSIVKKMNDTYKSWNEK